LGNPKLTEDELQELENDLSKEELLNALRVLRRIKLLEKIDSLKSSMKLTFLNLIGDHLLARLL